MVNFPDFEENEKYYKDITDSIYSSNALVMKQLEKINGSVFKELNKQLTVKIFSDPFFNAECDFTPYITHFRDEITGKTDEQISLYYGVPMTLSTLPKTRKFISEVFHDTRGWHSKEVTKEIVTEIVEIFNAWDVDEYPKFIPNSHGISPSIDPFFMSVQCFVLAHEVGHCLIRYDKSYDAYRFVKHFMEKLHLRKNKLNDAKESLEYALDNNDLYTTEFMSKIRQLKDKKSGGGGTYFDNWVEEIYSDIIAYEMCENMKIGNGDFALIGLSLNNAIQAIMEQYCLIRKGYAIPEDICEYHPISNIRLIALERYLEKRSKLNKEDFLKTKEWAIPIVISVTILRILEQVN